MRSRSTPTPGPPILLVGLTVAGCGPWATGPAPEPSAEAVEAAEPIPRVLLYGRDLPEGVTERPGTAPFP